MGLGWVHRRWFPDQNQRTSTKISHKISSYFKSWILENITLLKAAIVVKTPYRTLPIDIDGNTHTNRINWTAHRVTIHFCYSLNSLFIDVFNFWRKKINKFLRLCSDSDYKIKLRHGDAYYSARSETPKRTRPCCQFVLSSFKQLSNYGLLLFLFQFSVFVNEFDKEKKDYNFFLVICICLPFIFILLLVEFFFYTLLQIVYFTYSNKLFRVFLRINMEM